MTSVLAPQTEVILVVHGDWYREMVGEGLLPATQDTGPTEVLPGHFVEQTQEGYWIDLPHELSQVMVPSLFVPSKFIWGIAIADLAERKKMGFKN